MQYSSSSTIVLATVTVHSLTQDDFFAPVSNARVNLIITHDCMAHQARGQKGRAQAHVIAHDVTPESLVSES
ncbi:hypothetical protein CBOM_08082 [Ceraceosorus bombacis]|uniref:Uncharacterized protein n=1 Tax=Ceraceosorus bombacis TaxID=401625 RepID=A0A0P1BTP0_9BASI|nr:hypothetical protein CBOM_08082 [Ceraceosorus bombacis]